MIELWEKDKIPEFHPDFDDNIPYLTYYPVENSKGCVIVCPGGGYGNKAPHEGAVIAERLNEYSLSAFVLSYRVAPHKFPVQLYDVVRAIKHVRFYCDKYQIDPHKIAIMGFSAGGHLASMGGTLYNYGSITDEIDKISGRPDAMALCYPVIQWGVYEHTGSRLNLIGNDKDRLYNLTNTALQITHDTPPAFLWTTCEDTAVPPFNSFLFANELIKNNVMCELHMYPTGPHGIGLGDDNPEAKKWVESCVNFLINRAF